MLSEILLRDYLSLEIYFCFVIIVDVMNSDLLFYRGILCDLEVKIKSRIFKFSFEI